MKVQINYYIPVQKTIEMTPEEYCHFHANGKFHGENPIPENAIREEIVLDNEAQEELDKFFYR